MVRPQEEPATANQDKLWPEDGVAVHMLVAVVPFSVECEAAAAAAGLYKAHLRSWCSRSASQMWLLRQPSRAERLPGMSTKFWVQASYSCPERIKASKKPAATTATRRRARVMSSALLVSDQLRRASYSAARRNWHARMSLESLMCVMMNEAGS